MWANLSAGTCPNVTFIQLIGLKRTSSFHTKIKECMMLKPKNSIGTITYPI